MQQRKEKCDTQTCSWDDFLTLYVQGIASRLVKAALQEAAKKREMRYSDLQKVERGVRRHFHDDITVMVLFLDHKLIKSSSLRIYPISIKGGEGIPPPAAVS